MPPQGHDGSRAHAPGHAAADACDARRRHPACAEDAVPRWRGGHVRGARLTVAPRGRGAGDAEAGVRGSAW